MWHICSKTHTDMKSKMMATKKRMTIANTPQKFKKTKKNMQPRWTERRRIATVNLTNDGFMPCRQHYARVTPEKSWTRHRLKINQLKPKPVAAVTLYFVHAPTTWLSVLKRLIANSYSIEKCSTPNQRLGIIFPSDAWTPNAQYNRWWISTIVTASTR